MMKIRSRSLFAGSLVLALAAGLHAQALADETAEMPTGPMVFDVPTQLAQGVSGYEVPGRRTAVPRGETVTSRPRPELDPLGARLGSFRAFPKIVVEERYSDNIFSTKTNEEDDFITRIMPSLNINSDWNNHSLGFQSGARIGRYWDNTDEDYEDYFVGATGRVDIKRSTAFRVRAKYQRQHEDRSSPDDVAASKPTEFDDYTAGAGLSHDFGRFNAAVNGSYQRLSFINNNESDRDRDIMEAALRLGYRISPQYQAFVSGSYNVREYDTLEGGLDRDSDGYGLVAGLDLDLGGLVFGDFFVGYRSQEYDDPTLSSLDGVGGGADITWNVTPLTTIVFSVLSDLRETTSTGASGRLVSTGGLTVDHELLRNLLLAGNLSLTRDDYEGINRTDWVYRAGFGANYMLNRNLYLGADYDFRKRDADSGGSDFTENVVLVRLQVQY
jgi:hypothetical protein